MIATRKDLLLLALAATIGAMVGTVFVGLVTIQLNKSTNPAFAPIRNFLLAGINGAELNP